MLNSTVDRLSRTLLVDRVAIFLADDELPNNFLGQVLWQHRLRRPMDLELPERLEAGMAGTRPLVLRQHPPGSSRNARGTRDYSPCWN